MYLLEVPRRGVLMNEPRVKKTCFHGFRPGPIQTPGSTTTEDGHT